MDENKSQSKPPFSLVGVVIILGILAVIALVAIPNFIRTRSTRAMNACVNNLRQIDAAKQQWALENSKADTDYRVDWGEITPYLGRGATGSLDHVYCPDDQTKQVLRRL